MLIYQRKRVRQLSAPLCCYTSQSSTTQPSSHAAQANLIGIFTFILLLEIAFLLVGIGYNQFDLGDTPTPKFRTHLNAVFAVRIALIAMLTLFVAFMGCNPVIEKEEVRHCCCCYYRRSRE